MQHYRLCYVLFVEYTSSLKTFEL